MNKWTQRLKMIEDQHQENDYESKLKYKMQKRIRN